VRLVVLACCAFVWGVASAAATVAATSKCKRGTVPVRVQGKLRCEKLRHALPRPQTGDPRLSFAHVALGANLRAARDRHGRRLEPWSRFARGKPYRAFLNNLPTALARLDRIARPRAGSDLARSASGGCKSGIPETSSSYQGSDGTSVGLTTNPDGSTTVHMATSVGNGTRVSVQFNSSECNYFNVPSCPTADGQLDGTDRHPLEIRIVVGNASGTLHSQTVTANSTENLHGAVADDAKLDELIINDNSSFGFVTAGSEVGHVISEHFTISRQAHVNMRLGYALATSGAVSISGSVDGISLTRAELAAEELRAKASADEEFAKIMKQEIDRYRTLEKGFDTAQTCVHIAFAPTSGSKPVHAGDNGSFQARVDMKSGSGSPTGKWKLVSQRGASFLPSGASHHQTTFRYSVPSKTSATRIAASLSATSKAGVATGDWTQPIKSTSLYLRIVGYTRSEQSTTTNGQMTITATLAGGKPGPVTAAPPCTSLASCLIDVELGANVTSTESGYVTGTPEPVTCPGGTFTFSPASFPNTLSLTVEFDPTGTSPAISGDGMLPSVGDALDLECGVNEFGDLQSAGGSVPLADLLSGNPVTFKFSGSGTTPSSLHPSISISWMLSESVTVQRVQADGTPFTAAAARLIEARAGRTKDAPD
jgi:hypothetical protein